MSIFLFIPARMGSSRFPGKPLFKLFGKPMIQWIYEASIKSKADKVYITTPDKEIINFCKSMNYPFIKTSVKHERCLDRIGEAYEYIEPKEESDILVCMQGDEPLVTTNMINKLIDFHLKGQYEFVVSALKINEEEFLNKNIVKIAYDDNFQTIYTSRSPIPHSEEGHKNAVRIFGLFSLSPIGIKKFINLKVNRLEILESCDTNRICGTDLHQFVCIQDSETIQQSVDTKDDALTAEKLIENLYQS